MMYTSQFWKIGPYDWFCGPGSHMIWLIYWLLNKLIFGFQEDENVILV